ncbi:D-lactonohydrolase-like protein [Crassisporium funariophilum]|nr:D-lactonohydrolase-like protein [Crassisporium funariophilum]
MNYHSYIASAVFVAVCSSILVYSQVDSNGSSLSSALPPQAVFVDPRSFAVLGPQGPFRNDSFNDLFNPTSTPTPFFQVFHQDFLAILGPTASIHEVASNATFAFAHEAPIYVAETDEVFFASNDGGALGNSDLNRNNEVGMINMGAVEAALKGLAVGKGTAVDVPVTELVLPVTVQMTNGGTGPYNSSLLLITSGRGPLPPSIVLVNPKSPHNTTVLLDNFFGRQFNSLNDIKIHPSGVIFFTDVVYGFLNHFRPAPLVRNQVYRLDPVTRAVRVVATDFDKCNGIAFSPNGKVAYIADTGAAGGFLGNNQTEPATMQVPRSFNPQRFPPNLVFSLIRYAFDVDANSQTFLNRRIFAYVDTGVPDGVQVDKAGNVYAGCGDGVQVCFLLFSAIGMNLILPQFHQVWNPQGTLLGKFFLGTTSANMVFAGDGRLVIMAETKIFVAKIAAKANKVSFP